MRVLYLIDSLTEGGAERSLAALAPGMIRGGVDLDVAFVHDRAGVGPRLEAAGARLHSLEGSAGIAGATWRAAQLRRRLRPDIVHTTLFEADLVGRTAAVGSKVKVATSLVNAAYGPEQLANPRLTPWKVRTTQTLDAATARRVDRFHAVSQAVADVMIERLHLRADRVDVVPRGRDADELGRRTADRRAAARAALDVAAHERLVLAVGRQEFQKGFDVLLRAFAELRAQRTDVRLMIAGRAGGASADLANLTRDLGIAGAVDFLGARTDIAELLCAADGFAFPSRWEGMPGSILEAMALEVPIVASDITMVSEVVAEEEAWIVPVGDAGALAQSLAAALDDPAAATRTAAARAHFLRDYTLDRAVDGMLAFYARLMPSARR